MTTGIDAFAKAMSELSMAVEIRGPIVLVETHLGTDADGALWVGTDPPPDFPTIPAHWIHLPVHIDLDGGGKQASELGDAWAKWSRPHKFWTDSASPGAQWLAHTRAVLETTVT